jgi:hypothetical protein
MGSIMNRFRHSSTAARYVILSRRAAIFLEQGAILVYRDKSITTFCLNLLLKNKCLDHLNLEYSEISHTTLDDESCSVVAVAVINQLYLEYCEFEDEEAVQFLVDNVRVEPGPTVLFLDGEPLNSSERLGYFMKALRGNTYLEQFDLGSLGVRTGSFQVLVAALLENRRPTRLG